MATEAKDSYQAEEQLVASLAQLGVGYLTRQNSDPLTFVIPAQELLSRLVCQPTSRARTAFIALLLARPDYAKYVPKALKMLETEAVQRMRFFYTAAVYLQQEHAEALKTELGENWRKLPDLFSKELRITGKTPKIRLQTLARLQAQSSGEILNWAGTFENVVQLLIHRWKVEKIWKASLHNRS